MYCKTQHSVYSITLHLVLVVKYRRDVINDTISKRIQEIFETIGLSHGVELIEWNHDSDHIHTLIKDFLKILAMKIKMYCLKLEG